MIFPFCFIIWSNRWYSKFRKCNGSILRVWIIMQISLLWFTLYFSWLSVWWNTLISPTTPLKKFLRILSTQNCCWGSCQKMGKIARRSIKMDTNQCENVDLLKIKYWYFSFILQSLFRISYWSKWIKKIFFLVIELNYWYQYDVCNL